MCTYVCVHIYCMHAYHVYASFSNVQLKQVLLRAANFRVKKDWNMLIDLHPLTGTIIIIDNNLFILIKLIEFQSLCGYLWCS